MVFGIDGDDSFFLGLQEFADVHSCFLVQVTEVKKCALPIRPLPGNRPFSARLAHPAAAWNGSADDVLQRERGGLNRSTRTSVKSILRLRPSVTTGIDRTVRRGNQPTIQRMAPRLKPPLNTRDAAR
jgi:hypothetical protein